MIEEKEVLALCLKHGARKAYLLDVDRIPFDEKLRSYCEDNKCGYFGNNYACPPHVGETPEVIAEAKSYKKAIVFQTVSSLSGKEDYNGMLAAHKIHNEVSNQIGEEIALIYRNHLDLRAGPCKVCEECTIIYGEPCKYPDRKRASLEAYCINVSELAKKCGIDYIFDSNSVSYFGAFLLK